MSTRRTFLKQLGTALPLAGWSFSQAWATVCKRPAEPADLAFLAREVELMSRSQWTRTPPRPWLLRSAHRFDRITVHHSGSATHSQREPHAVAHNLEGILAGHVRRRYGDIGYHFVVDQAGRVWEGRSLAYEGAHVRAENDGNIGAVLLGNFETDVPTSGQLCALRRLVGALRARFRIAGDRVYGHRDLGYSACPGLRLYPHVVRLRRERVPSEGNIAMRSLPAVGGRP